ncbi:MAG: aldo/keto reductase, partial [Planctomycetota bacterium]
MNYRPLGSTGLNLPVLSFGASSLGQEFRQVDLTEAIRS